MTSDRDLKIRAARPPKPVVDPWRAIGAQAERERLRDGRIVPSWTLFLAGKECPFTCVFCDLWQYTTDEPTPPGAIPQQIRAGLDELKKSDPAGYGGIVKLYNASNFFDSGAVPPADDGEIARLVEDFDKVVVECHPKLVGRRCFELGRRLEGRLEVAMGFETACPEAFSRLNKKAELEDLKAASARLREHGIGVRAFLLLGAPFVPPGDEMPWLEKSVMFALECGASSVWLIPVRESSQELRDLKKTGEFSPPDLDRIEEGFARCAALDPGARLDTWDLESFADDPEGADRERLATLRRLQLAPTAEVDLG